LQILQQNQQRLLGREPAEELREVPHQASLELSRVGFTGGSLPLTSAAECREERPELRASTPRKNGERGRVQLPQQGKQSIGEERVGNASLDRIRSPNGEGPPALGGAVGGGGCKPRLSNAAFTDDEHRASRALRRLIDRAGEERKLRAPPD
jgi:hypothetical protein